MKRRFSGIVYQSEKKRGTSNKNSRQSIDEINGKK